ncbi:hypothetical protein ACFOUP_08065 [Belliella kenyensis]|uniref:Uncharacterized protein n=1 Tax=Belliella kenyensis TaxID=1472724 RepID=A0ABV8EMV2_9BACT|nr:hypothetical protein [Belliella kenyensis]MCH7400428.1 hypothetical protein [Belliella kenyensis]MDN3604555.1 hypothetical protein [Belliella kenyensis]
MVEQLTVPIAIGMVEQLTVPIAIGTVGRCPDSYRDRQGAQKGSKSYPFLFLAF